MNRKVFALLLALLLLLMGCVSAGTDITRIPPAETLRAITEATATDAPPAETEAPEAPEAPPAETEDVFVPDEDGEYTAPEQVAEYLHLYGRLPGNFITKKEAEALGWPGGDLWKYAPGKSIGGSSFGNREGLLPEGTKYHECDVNYAGGSRGAERLVYGDHGGIYYTNDHYASFTQLY